MSTTGNHRRYDARFVIGEPNGPRSCLWRIWRTNNEVYVAASNLGGIEKISFHSGGICRKAFTSERGTPSGIPDRATHKWRRLETPSAGSLKGICVLEIGVPTNYLSTSIEPLDRPVTWIQPAPKNMAVILEMLFTLEPESIVREKMELANRPIHTYTKLPNGEAFVVTSRVAEFTGENFRVPPSHHEKHNIVFSSEDPENTGRPIRITIYTNPADGDRMIAWEYGGYRASNDSILDFQKFGTFNRSVVLDKSKFE